MSALGHERTLKSRIRDVRLTPQERTMLSAPPLCLLSDINGHWGFSRSALFCTARQLVHRTSSILISYEDGALLGAYLSVM